MKKSQQSELNNLSQAKCLHNHIEIFNFFFNTFKLVQKAFCGGSITFLEINVKGMPRKYSSTLRTLCNSSIFRTLVYLEPWYIQNQRHMQNPGIFRTEVYLETLGYSELKTNSEPFQTSMMEHCAENVNSYSCFRKL